MLNEMAIMGSSGDTKIIWDPDKFEEVENARRTFNDLVKIKKYAAFAVGRKGQKEDRITEFDPAEAQMILIPQMAGG